MGCLLDAWYIAINECKDCKTAVLTLTNGCYLQPEEISCDDYGLLYCQLQKEFRELCRAHQLLQARLANKQGKSSC